jgi:site-specific DNA-methyltransferase (adenine-specific)
MIELLNIDCMEYMATLPDNAFDLAVVDPPYGIGDVFIPVSTGVKPCKIERTHKVMDWDNEIPTPKYFIELKRVSKKQIIWGANYFNCFNNGGALIWYKNNGAPTLSQCEIASLSFKKSVDYVFIQVLGGFVQKDKPIHPTQKPVALYKWLLHNYAKQGDKILDTHLGSGSSSIAAHNMGFDFVGCELDKDYYDAACKRFKEQTKQLSLL